MFLPLSSLRGRLLLLLAVPTVLIAAAAIAQSYLSARETVHQLYDKTLLAVTLTISEQVVATDGDLLAETVLESLTQGLGDPLYYHATGPGSAFVTGYGDPPPLPSGLVLEGGQTRFFDSSYLGQPVRVAALRQLISDGVLQGWVTVRVWQTLNEREALSLSLALDSLLRMLVIIVCAALVLWFGISRGLRPLAELRESVERRSPTDLSDIRRPVPAEVTSLVAAMNHLFQRLKAAFAEREAFIANASHQLRNPIAAIQSQAEAAAKAKSEDELRRRVEGIAEAARRSGRLTNQLLSLTRTRSQAEEPKKPFDLAAETAEILRSHSPRGLRRDMEISFEAPETPVEITGNRLMLGEAISNLIDNAIRYGRDGGRLEVGVHPHADKVVVVVEDDGPGVPPADAERIFDRFIRLTEEVPEGCGLGLAIAREVAQAHDGNIHFSNGRLGKGSRFELQLPGRSSTAPQTDGPEFPTFGRETMSPGQPDGTASDRDVR